MIYPSEKDFRATVFYWTSILIGAFLAAYYLYLLFTGLASWWPDIINVIIGLGAAGLVLSFYLKIQYEFDDEARELIVRTGFFTERIKYKEIIEIEETTKVLSFSSLSSKKIRIKHGQFRNTGDHQNAFLSPTPRAEFIAHLKAVCPKVKVFVPGSKKK